MLPNLELNFLNTANKRSKNIQDFLKTINRNDLDDLKLLSCISSFETVGDLSLFFKSLVNRVKSLELKSKTLAKVDFRQSYIKPIINLFLIFSRNNINIFETDIIAPLIAFSPSSFDDVKHFLSFENLLILMRQEAMHAVAMCDFHLKKLDKMALNDTNSEFNLKELNLKSDLGEIAKNYLNQNKYDDNREFETIKSLVGHITTHIHTLMYSHIMLSFKFGEMSIAELSTFIQSLRPVYKKLKVAYATKELLKDVEMLQSDIDPKNPYIAVPQDIFIATLVYQMSYNLSRNISMNPAELTKFYESQSDVSDFEIFSEAQIFNNNNFQFHHGDIAFAGAIGNIGNLTRLKPQQHREFWTTLIEYLKLNKRNLSAISINQIEQQMSDEFNKNKKAAEDAGYPFLRKEPSSPWTDMAKASDVRNIDVPMSANFKSKLILNLMEMTQDIGEDGKNDILSTMEALEYKDYNFNFKSKLIRVVYKLFAYTDQGHKINDITQALLAAIEAEEYNTDYFIQEFPIGNMYRNPNLDIYQKPKIELDKLFNLIKDGAGISLRAKQNMYDNIEKKNLKTIEKTLSNPSVAIPLSIMIVLSIWQLADVLDRHDNQNKISKIHNPITEIRSRYTESQLILLTHSANVLQSKIPEGFRYRFVGDYLEIDFHDLDKANVKRMYATYVFKKLDELRLSILRSEDIVMNMSQLDQKTNKLYIPLQDLNKLAMSINSLDRVDRAKINDAQFWVDLNVFESITKDNSSFEMSQSAKNDILALNLSRAFKNGFDLIEVVTDQNAYLNQTNEPFSESVSIKIYMKVSDLDKITAILSQSGITYNNQIAIKSVPNSSNFLVELSVTAQRLKLYKLLVSQTKF